MRGTVVIVVILALCRIAPAGDHVTVEADTVFSGWAIGAGVSLGVEHRFDRWSGATLRVRVDHGDLFEEPATTTQFGALAGYRIHSPNADDPVGVFAGVELGWLGARTPAYDGDFEAHFATAWDHSVDVELSAGVCVLKRFTIELRVQAPVLGAGAAIGLTL